MAKKAEPAISPEATYRVILTRSVKVGRNHVHPGSNAKLRGDVITWLKANDAGAVESFELYSDE